jgi:glycosyltransferase involved in cell wall biosynthesis
MPNIIGSITRTATRKEEGKFNILTFSTHEAFETGLAKTGHNFYAYRDNNVKDWNHTYRPLPPNYTLFNPLKGPAQIPSDLDFDIVLSQNKFGQYELAKRFADAWHLPLISLEHTLPHPTWTPSHLAKLKELSGDVNVFIAEYSRKEWGWADNEAQVVHHGIDTEVFSPRDDFAREPHLLSVVNDWINRDWCCGFRFWREATDGLPVCVLGATPGLSQPAKTLDELVYAYRRSQIFVNTSTVSPVPTALLEAMSSGCCVVSTATCMIPEIIEHGVNGFLCDSSLQMKNILLRLLDEPLLCAKIGQAARQTILDRFNLSSFTNSWNDIFKHAAAIVKHRTNASVCPIPKKKELTAHLPNTWTGKGIE